MLWPFRVVLPASLGLVSLGLMVWDVLAQRACVYHPWSAVQVMGTQVTGT